MTSLKLDPADEWLLDNYTWYETQYGYMATHVLLEDGRQKFTLMHHCIMGTPIWQGEFIDHRNRDRLDNRRCNLRWVDFYESNQNRSSVVNAKNITLNNGWYQVRVQRDGELHYVGTFRTMEEAIGARDAFFECRIQNGNA